MNDLDMKHLFEQVLDWMYYLRIGIVSGERPYLNSVLIEKEEYIRAYLKTIKEGE